MRVWWNGAEVMRDDKYRDLDADRFATRVKLRAGYNRLLVKACGDDDAKRRHVAARRPMVL